MCALPSTCSEERLVDRERERRPRLRRRQRPVELLLAKRRPVQLQRPVGDRQLQRREREREVEIGRLDPEPGKAGRRAELQKLQRARARDAARAARRRRAAAATRARSRRRPAARSRRPARGQHHVELVERERAVDLQQTREPDVRVALHMQATALGDRERERRPRLRLRQRPVELLLANRRPVQPQRPVGDRQLQRREREREVEIRRLDPEPGEAAPAERELQQLQRARAGDAARRRPAGELQLQREPGRAGTQLRIAGIRRAGSTTSNWSSANEPVDSSRSCELDRARCPSTCSDSVSSTASENGAAASCAAASDQSSFCLPSGARFSFKGRR